MRFRHRASVSPAFGRGGGVEPYRGSETYLGEQATLRQELGDVGGKHDVSVDGGRGGSEVSGEPISKGYARAPRSRGSRARETRRRRRRDACRSIRTRSNACIARIEDRARVRYRAGHRRRARRGFRRARGNPRLRARTPFVAAAKRIAHRGARENVARGCARTCTRRCRRSTSRSTESAACCAVLEVSGRSCRTQWSRARRRHALAQTILSRSRFKTRSSNTPHLEMFLRDLATVVCAITLRRRKKRGSPRGKTVNR